MARGKEKEKKVVYEGILFETWRKYEVYREYEKMLKDGKLSNLELRKKIELIPPQYETVKGRRRCIEKGMSLTADFVLTYPDGRTEVVIVLGSFKPTIYTMKRKLLLFTKGIKVKEVK